jgi:hypothetical protein
MTVNKSQGQSFDIIGVDLRTPVFTHGQLYVALSRVTDITDLSLLLPSIKQFGQTDHSKVIIFGSESCRILDQLANRSYHRPHFNNNAVHHSPQVSGRKISWKLQNIRQRIMFVTGDH